MTSSCWSATPRRAEPVIAEVRDAQFRADAVVADVTHPAEVAAAVEEIVQTYGRIDVLVNNAGFCVHRAALEVTPEEWRSVMDVNVDGVWNCAQAFGRQMVSQNGGSIVNIGSISGQIVNRPQWQPGYNASKAAVHQLTKSLAAEWAPHGVRVNALAPGYMKTEMAPVDRPRVAATGSRTRRCSGTRYRRSWAPVSSFWPRRPRRSSPARCWSSTAGTPSSEAGIGGSQKNLNIRLNLAVIRTRSGGGHATQD